MRIGIITYWSSQDNYGQILQCYALQKYLINFGHDAFLIKYLPTTIKESLFQRIRKYLSIKKMVYLFSTEYKKDKLRYREELRLEKSNRELNKKRLFDCFKTQHIRATENIYHSLRELRENPPEADVYICGSDQVWNNSLYKSETGVWYLSFGDKKSKRIAYAASIGRIIEKRELNLFKAYLNRFDAISVREESSQQMCEREGIKGVTVTLDPTLLLPINEYKQLSAPVSYTKPYIFMYILNVSKKEDIYWDRIQVYLKSKGMDLKIVCSSGYIQARELLQPYRNIQATIPEWLGLIECAQCIITTSFHGVVFCIKMHKPFLAILLKNKYAKGNDRITSLLHKLDLSNRIYNSNVSIELQMSNIIDWVLVDQKLSYLSEISRDFLNKI